MENARDMRAWMWSFALLAALVIGCLVACGIHVSRVGTSYRYPLADFPGVELTPADFAFSPEGMAEVTDVSMENGIPVATIVGREPGSGMGIVTGDAGGMGFAVSVHPSRVVVVDNVNFTGWEWVGWSLAICFSVAFLICVCNAIWLLRHSWYGYGMAANMGGALFCAMQAIVFTQVMAAGEATSFYDLALLITTIADRFVDVLLVPVAAIAALVCASNLVLMRHEGARPTNLLGVFASIAFVIAYAALEASAFIPSDSYGGTVAIFTLGSVIATAISFGLALLIGVSLAAWLAARHVPSFPRDYVMVLGCGMRSDGTPTPLLAGRVDAALAYADRQVEAGHAAPTLVPSGGQGADEPMSEAACMARYAEQRHAGDLRIIEEGRSTTTRENFACSAPLIAEDAGAGARPRVAFATTNYHVFRAYVYAHEADLDAEGIASPTKFYFWPNAFLREFAGLLVRRAVPIGLALIAVEVVYVVAQLAILLR